jgi:cytochrome P450
LTFRAVSLERKALRDVMLPDGRKIPRGTQIAVDASLMWSPDVYDFPDRFDGHRFVKHRDAGGTSFAFTSTSKDHVTFGMGRAICPGRFFAESELKLCLAQILLDYDLRLTEGYIPRSFYAGFYPVVDPFAKIEVRRLRTDM